MGYCNFCGYRERKRSRDGENASDGLHPEIITPTQQPLVQKGKQYVESKGWVTNNGDISIHTNAGMASQTCFNARTVSTTRQSPVISATQRLGWWEKNSEGIQKYHMLQVRPTRRLHQVMSLQGGRTRKIWGQGKQPGQNHTGNQSHNDRNIKYECWALSRQEQRRDRIQLWVWQQIWRKVQAHARRIISPSL